MHTRTVLDRIEIEPQTGNVSLRMLKRIADDSGKVLASDYHRTSIPSNTDLDIHMAAVNAHLVSMGYPALSEADTQQIRMVTAGLCPALNDNSSTP
jgi:hypothetical protein